MVGSHPSREGPVPLQPPKRLVPAHARTREADPRSLQGEESSRILSDGPRAPNLELARQASQFHVCTRAHMDGPG